MKSKGLISATGNLSFPACDEIAQRILYKKERFETSLLDGKVSFETLEELAESIKNIIYMETPTEIVKIEVDSITEIPVVSKAIEKNNLYLSGSAVESLIDI